MIGSRLCAYLADRNYSVVVLTRNAPRAALPGVRYVTWDPETAGSWASEINNSLAVVNLCGETIAGKRWTKKRKSTLVSSRTVPSQALVTAVNAATSPPTVFLQASGVGFYGTGFDEKTEDSPSGEDWLAELALAWEAPLKQLSTRHGVLRLGVVLDVRGGALPQMVMPFRFFVGGKIAGGNQWFSWVHIQDVLRVIEFALDNDEIRGPVNVVAPDAITNADLTAAISKVMNRPALFSVPGFAMQLLLGEQATLVCDGQKVKPARLAAAGFEFKFPRIKPALENLLSD